MNTFRHVQGGRPGCVGVLAGLALLMGFVALPGSVRAAATPNLVYILADDVGYGDLGCYGATHVKTPHLDRLAREGLRFTDAHATASVCTPTRYAFMTGRYAWRQPGTGIAAGNAPAILRPGTVTVASLLKQAGYATGLVGKWHLGLGETNTDFNAEIKPGPLELGFDYAFFIPATGDRVPCVFVENHRVAGYDPADPIQVSYGRKIGDEPTGKDPGGPLKIQGGPGHLDTVVNGIPRIGFMTGGRAARWVDEDIADTLAARAVRFIESHRDHPFFLYLAPHDIHEPMVPHPRFRGTSDCGWRGDVIHQLDWTVGEVLAALDRCGLANSTLVLFTSDNGGAIKNTYDDGTNPLHGRQKPNGAWRGFKGSLYEGGHRVPFIARWPGRIPAGGTSDRLIAHVDTLATVAALTGQRLPDDAGPDSFNVLSAWLGDRTAPPPRDHLVLQNNGPTPLALRQGDCVLIQKAGGQRRQGQAAAGSDVAFEFYDLAADPAQTNNLATREPERVAAFAARLETLRQQGHSRARGELVPTPESRGSRPAGASRFGSVGAAALTNVADLPLLREGVETRQFSAYDRAGDNYDHEYFPLYMEPNGECVIFDAMGPGCLYRHHMNLWYPWQGKEIHRGVRIRYYFDGEPQPRIDQDVSTFFSAQNPLGLFREPLGVDGGNRFRVLYYPMVFRQRLKVALSAEPGGPGSAQIPWEGRHEAIPQRRSHWYQYTYHLFSEDPGLPSWTPESVTTGWPALWEKPGFGQNPLATVSAPPERVTTPVAPAERARLWQRSGAGALTSLRLALTDAAPDALFTTWLRITFDGRAEPQVEAPVGCFFGAYRTAPASAYAALLLGYSPTEMYCHLPMPFWASATVEVENRGSRPVTVQAQLQTWAATAPPYRRDRCGYLHARYRREAPRTEGQDYTYLDFTGAGHVVGHTVARWDTSMEENERTYFNGSRTPQVQGNGFEDDHNMGWGLQNLTHAVFGAHGAEGGAGSIYRFYLPDLYAFESGVRHGHQAYGPRTPRGHEGLYAVGTEESVTFYYAVDTPRLTLTDEFDVGNPDAEARQRYKATGNLARRTGEYWYDGAANNVLTPTPATLDDGVAFDGTSTFTVAVAPDNRGIKLRRRTDKENNRQCAWVSIDGQRVTERPWYSVDFDRAYRNIRWWDTDFEVPVRYTQGKSEVTVTLEFVSAENGVWDEFRYWVYSRR